MTDSKIHQVRVRKLDTGDYVFRTSLGFGPILRRINLEGHELPEREGFTAAELRHLIPGDCLFKRITFVSRGRKYGYHVDAADMEHQIQLFREAPETIRVVYFETGKKPRILIAASDEDTITPKDLTVGKSLDDVNTFVMGTIERAKKREREKVQKERDPGAAESTKIQELIVYRVKSNFGSVAPMNLYRVPTFEAPMQEPDGTIADDVHSAAASPRYTLADLVERPASRMTDDEYTDRDVFLVPVVRGVNLLEITLEDEELEDGDDYWERRKNLTGRCLNRNIGYLNLGSTSVYIVPPGQIDKLMTLVIENRPDVRLKLVDYDSDVQIIHEPSARDLEDRKFIEAMGSRRA